MSADSAPRQHWLAAFGVYRERNVLAMLFLGFSAGLPLLLVFGTLSAWLNHSGVDKTTIGFVSWVALAYGLKFLWSPLVDRMPLPVLTDLLGQRRGWMLLAQVGVITGLMLASMTDPVENLKWVVIYSIVTAFSSATQDITIDAWRIEAAEDEKQGAMAGAYQLGYRIGMIFAGSLAFVIADLASWPVAYQVMAGFMLIGMATTLLIDEPDHSVRAEDTAAEERLKQRLLGNTAGRIGDAWYRFQAWFVGAVVGPFADFFSRHGWTAAVILGFIAVFRMSDITLGVMAFPFYQDMGYSGTEIGLVSGLVGKFVTISGALIGGVLVVRYGVMPMLLAGASIVILTNLAFVWLASGEATLWGLIVVVSADNLAGGFAGTTFIAYLSLLTNRVYTATQYALFSSIMLLLPKFIAGFSGVVVDATSYPIFFSYSALLGVPALVLVLVLMRMERRRSDTAH